MSKEKQIDEMARSLNEATFGVNVHTLADHLHPETIHKVAEYLYNAGYCKQGEWISVEDDLPKNQLARVLVLLKDDEFTKPIGFNKIDTDRYIDGKWARCGKHVAHWMPLPEPPKG